MPSVLLADDDAVHREQLASTLRETGFTIETADTVESTIQCALGRAYDAIMLEFDLLSELSTRPRIAAGLYVIDQLRTAGVIVPILILTASDGRWCETASLNAGADDVLWKSADALSLAARLRAHLRRRILRF